MQAQAAYEAAVAEAEAYYQKQQEKEKEGTIFKKKSTNFV